MSNRAGSLRKMAVALERFETTLVGHDPYFFFLGVAGAGKGRSEL